MCPIGITNRGFTVNGYPFIPKSTARMKAGQFWGVPLRGKGFACGIILSIEKKHNGKRDSRRFLAGLLNWVGLENPTPTQIIGREVIAHGFAHLKTITENGRCLLGEVEPWWPWPPELENLHIISTWGYGVISVLAQHYFGEKIEPGVSPKDGLTKPIGNSGAHEGTPPVN